MLYGIIDVGSNTIRLNIYSYKDQQLKSLLHKKTMAGLAGYVKDGYLTAKGIKVACSTIKDYKDVLSNFNIKNIHTFATASLRNIVNTDEVVRNILDETSLRIDVISGEEEAMLGFKGTSVHTNINTGLYMDIGGGSTELVTFEHGQIIRAVSLPIGSLSLYSKHVKKVFPNNDEISSIKEHILKELQKIAKENKQPYADICGVGGTIRAAKKLNQHLFSEQPADFFHTHTIPKTLQSLHKADKKMLRKVLQIVPDRIHTIIPGMMILHMIAEHFDSKNITVCPFGVREGYLYTKVLKEG